MGVHENLLLRRHVEHHAHRARRVYDLTLVRVVNVLTGLLRIEAMDPIQIKVDYGGWWCVVGGEHTCDGMWTR